MDTLGRIIGIVSLGSALVLALVLRTSQPLSVGPLGLLFVFILIYLSALGLLTFLLFGALWAYLRVRGMIGPYGHIQPLTLRHSYYYASVLALAPVILLAAQSIGQLDIYDVSLVALFEIIACVYITKRWR